MGAQITVVPDARQIAAALADCRPGIWATVPRVWEKIRAAILATVAAEPDAARRQGMEWALGVANRKAEAALSGLPVTAELAAEYATADKLVMSAVRAKLGLDRLRWAVSGAAPMARQRPRTRRYRAAEPR